MSYDIYLDSFATQPASEAQIEAACAVIRCYGGHVSDDWSYFSGLWDDGCGFTMITRSLLFEEEAKPFGALLAPITGPTQRFCDFTYDFACAVDCAIRPDALSPITLVVDRKIVERLPGEVAFNRVRYVRRSIGIRNAFTNHCGWRVRW